jgi:hypothetical protein
MWGLYISERSGLGNVCDVPSRSAWPASALVRIRGITLTRTARGTAIVLHIAFKAPHSTGMVSHGVLCIGG